MWRWLWAGVLAVAAGGAAAQDCVGRDLLAAMPAAGRAALDARVAPVPHASGLLWEARRGGDRLVLAGTYHFPDPRHEALAARLRPELAGADVLLVEAGPEEEARLKAALASDPSLMAQTEGPTLPERLSPEEWRTLSAAMGERGMPAVVTAKLRPWYVATMLSLSPCMIASAKGEAGGLDHVLVAAATEAGVPVRALEPWDTMFGIFAGLSPQQELDMIRGALPAALHADDYATTMTNAYFAGDVWLIWEFGRADALAQPGATEAEVDAQLALAQERLMDRRNAAWIAPLEAAAAGGKRVVAAFGALHLPGEGGVLRLLERDGWTVTPLAGG